MLPASEDLWALDLEAVTSASGRSFRALRDLREAVEEAESYDVIGHRLPAQPVHGLCLRHLGQRRHHYPGAVRCVLHGGSVRSGGADR